LDRRTVGEGRPRGSTAGRRAPHAIGEQLGEDFRWLDLSSDGGQHGSDVARGRARRRYEQRREREERVLCGVSLALLQKDKDQAGGSARGAAASAVTASRAR
jgi:hypothetical protein